MIRKILKPVGVVLLSSMLAAPAIADTPLSGDRPITLVGPFAAGGSNDVIARIFANKLSSIVGKPVIVDNKPGAGGIVAAEYVARAPADGHTLLVVSPTFLISPQVNPNAQYDAVRDFTGVTGLYTTQVTWVTNPSFEAETLAGFVSLAKASPGKFTYATNGVGTFSHLQVEQFSHRHGIQLTHVPYKSLPEGSQAVIGKMVDIAVDTPFSVSPRVQAQRLRPLVVFGSTREPLLPGTPTNSEAGFADASPLTVFAGLVASSKTPPEIIESLAAASAKVLRDPEYRARLESSGALVYDATPAELNRELQSQSTAYAELLRTLKLSLAP